MKNTLHLQRYYFGHRRAIAQADARPAMPVSLREYFNWRNNGACGRPLVKPLGSREEESDGRDTRQRVALHVHHPVVGAHELCRLFVSAELPSTRIITIRVNASPCKITIIQVYAPTTDHSDEEIEEFYQQLENTVKKMPKKDRLVVMGDWNAKIGSDAYEQRQLGRYRWQLRTFTDTNQRGLRLLELQSWTIRLSST